MASKRVAMNTFRDGSRIHAHRRFAPEEHGTRSCAPIPNFESRRVDDIGTDAGPVALRK